jgi:hypothetical protein
MDGLFGIQRIIISFLILISLGCTSNKDAKYYKNFDEFLLKGRFEIPNYKDYNGYMYKIVEKKDTTIVIAVNNKDLRFYLMDSLTYINKGRYWLSKYQLKKNNSEKTFKGLEIKYEKFIFNDSIVVLADSYLNKSRAGNSIELRTKKDTLICHIDNNLQDDENKLDEIRKILKGKVAIR